MKLTNFIRSRNCSRIIWAICVSLVATFGSASLIDPCFIAHAQSTGDADSIPPPRHDDWRLVPQAMLTPSSDSQQLDLLNKRGNYFDKFLNLSGVPLDQPQPARQGGYSFSYGSDDEIPFFSKSVEDHETILVAKFDNYHTYLTPSRISIYTDIRMSVDQVLSDSSGISAGQTIDVLLDGGTVLLSDGRTLSSHIYDETSNFTLQPGHRYLLFLDYKSQGHFYTDEKDWDLSSGVAIPNRKDEAIRFHEGRSRYSGLSESSFIEAVREAIAEHKQGN